MADKILLAVLFERILKYYPDISSLLPLLFHLMLSCVLFWRHTGMSLENADKIAQILEAAGIGTFGYRFSRQQLFACTLDAVGGKVLDGSLRRDLLEAAAEIVGTHGAAGGKLGKGDGTVVIFLDEGDGALELVKITAGNRHASALQGDRFIRDAVEISHDFKLLVVLFSEKAFKECPEQLLIREACGRDQLGFDLSAAFGYRVEQRRREDKTLVDTPLGDSSVDNTAGDEKPLSGLQSIGLTVELQGEAALKHADNLKILVPMIAHLIAGMPLGKMVEFNGEIGGTALGVFVKCARNQNDHLEDKILILFDIIPQVNYELQ